MPICPTFMVSPVELPAGLEIKCTALRQSLRAHLERGLIVAFSGGVDSAFLLWTAEQERREHGGRLLAVTTLSESLAAVERQAAADFGKNLGVEHHWEKSEELSNPDYVRNDLMRCYHCKVELFRISHSLAGKLGFAVIAYGYNFSDRADFRPGQKAAEEQGIVAPLHDAGLEKDEIRTLMRRFGIPLADKPASPCLSSRLMRGVAVTSQKLRDVEDLESIVQRGGISVFRMRLHEHSAGEWLRLEVAPDEMSKVLEIRVELERAARARGFSWLTLDLTGYRMGGGSGTLH